MSVLDKASTAIDTNRGRGRNSGERGNTFQKREPSIYDGIYINPGIYVREPDGDPDEEPTFLRLPKGVFLSDLEKTKLYDTMTDERYAAVSKMNDIIDMLREKGLALKEGESISVKFECRMYRKMEESTKTETSHSDKAELEKSLFD